MLKYFICSTFLGSWVRVKWVTNVEGGRRGDKWLKMLMQRRGGGWDCGSIKFITLTADKYLCDAQNTCDNRLLKWQCGQLFKCFAAICQRDDKDDKQGKRAGGSGCRRWWRYMFVMCARILNDQWIQWSDAMQNSAVHFINERAGQRRVESTMMTRPNDQNGAKQKAHHSPNLNQQQQRRSGRRGRGENTPQPKQFPTKFLWKLVSLLITSLFVCKLE